MSETAESLTERKTYEPQAVEEKWYARWLADGCFTPDPASAKPGYSIVIPPPNVTGVLTLGHVLNTTLQDILARRARMQGKEALWLPGTDHAGIATQTVVEKMLRQEGQSRRDLGREAFLAKVGEWKEKHGGIIIQQLKKLGCSCDWTRERFTMDEPYSREVQRVFVELYHEGLIYRGNRMVNWCPVSLTALSDEEVIMTPQKGTLYQFKIEVAEEPGRFLSIATTRPETIPGDTAVAVNPKDPRYADLVGKHGLRPLPSELPDDQRRIPIVADDSVDFEFGTGVLKVTPAHDKVDFEIGQRHQLPIVDVMHPNGKMNELAGADLAGLDRFAARKKSVELLTELGLLEKEDPHENTVGFSERAGVPIEPRLSDQWFLRYPRVEESREAVQRGEIRFTPERWGHVYEHWMANIQDWCISRQLWWGHRIPAWYRNSPVAQASGLSTNPKTAGTNIHNNDDKHVACATKKSPLFEPFSEFANTKVSQRNLPHWQQDQVTYFVTFRLADSLPQSTLRDLQEERDRLRAQDPEAASAAERSFHEKIEQWLDRGQGTCLLRDQAASSAVAKALQHFDGERYQLGPWCVMPNHVHVLVTPLGGHDLPTILHSWKSFTAHSINEIHGLTGQVWQHESYDRIVRDADALRNIAAYIEGNPTEADLEAPRSHFTDQSPESPVAQASGLSSNPQAAGSNIQKNDDKPEACATIHVGLEPPPDPENWTQDPDVLDTWFSSWLWPFSTMDAATEAKFYPTDDLVTGPDIIFFWVARMIMAGYRFRDRKPFSHVFFTSLIRDAQGRKMSKSLGNSPDPLDLIAQYGADGVRFGLIRIAPHGQDIRFDEKQIEEGRNFANKLWNAARFRLMHGPGSREIDLSTLVLSNYATDIVAKLDLLIARVESAFADYRFAEIAQALYDFFWGEYCDRFVEAAKSDITGQDPVAQQSALAVMDYVLNRTLRLLHPYMPHITEELWQQLGYATGESDYLDFVPPPTVSELDPATVTAAQIRVEAVYKAVHAARHLRAEYRVPSNKKVRFILRSAPAWAAEELPTFSRLSHAEETTIDPLYQAEKGVPRALTPLGELYLPLDGLVDGAAERERFDKEMTKVEEELIKVTRKLSSESFVNNAPPAVVEEHRQREADWRSRLEQLRLMREALGE